MAEYKDTLFLPKTSFPIKGNLPSTEPKIQKKWEENGLYAAMRQLNAGGEKFVLHDGPPYANGNLHIGHALNKILKDATVRFQHIQGKQIEFIPGWDCHGLPIEWEVEKQYRKKKKNKDDDIIQFREDCRQYARTWVDTQREQFKRFGVVADWDNPYLTMDYDFEASIVEQLLKLVEEKKIYQDHKPVMWSPVEQTSLAEAEIVYKDVETTSAYVKFPIRDRKKEYIVIWTTTPWTLPSNQAIAYNPKLKYCQVDTGEEKYWVSANLAHDLMDKWGIKNYTMSEAATGSNLFRVIHNAYSSYPIVNPITGEASMLAGADFVSDDTGTGLVHIAPAHGEDDYKFGKSYGLHTKSLVQQNGVYKDHVPVVGGEHVFKCDELVLRYLENNNLLVATEAIKHSYPHSWRSKKPVIYMTAPQWFINLDGDDHSIQMKALKEIDNVDWHPKSGRNRIYSMVQNRDNWCISRQRAWGVPLTFFVDVADGSILNHGAVHNHVLEIIRKEGCDAWFTRSVEELMPHWYKHENFEKVTDVLDVWFDSGSTWAHVLGGRKADLYLEGSDQHRGWFQSSLLLSVANMGHAPYKEVLTHGFVLDEKRIKMSKSEKNVINPDDIINKHGADVLRLWALSSDYTSDLSLGNETISRCADVYRRIRNTMRYLLSNLQDHIVDDVEELPELEQYILAEMASLHHRLLFFVSVYDYHSVVHELHEFCNNLLSSFYFDIRKDCLYCDSVDSPKRQACMFVLDALYQFLTTWFAPILPFTMEEVWEHRNYGIESVHLTNLMKTTDWLNRDLVVHWQVIREIRQDVYEALEKERANGLFGKSLEAKVELTTLVDFRDVDPAELFIVSEVEVLDGEYDIQVTKAQGSKCARCWQIKEKLNGDLCDRCGDAVN